MLAGVKESKDQLDRTYSLDEAGNFIFYLTFEYIESAHLYLTVAKILMQSAW